MFHKHINSTLTRLFLTCGCLLFAAMAAFSQNTAENQSTDNEKKPVKPGSAWILSDPLGQHIPSTLDTLTYNYQRRSIPSMISDAYATTGNLGAQGINMLYFQRPSWPVCFFDASLSHLIPGRATQKNFNVYIPTTIVDYNFAGSRVNRTDRLSAQFAGNANRRIGVGAFVDYLYSKGCYEAQATKDFSFGANVYYIGDRYEMQTEYSHFNFLNKENGGITNDLYITDPAELQGGIDKIEAKSIPVRLSAAHTRLNGDELFMTHAFKLGYWKEEQVNDTLKRDVYVPMIKFVYSFDFYHRHHFFINSNSKQAHDFWQNFYLNSQETRENTLMHNITNTVGVEMIEGFRKWAKFGISAYAQLYNRHYKQATAPDRSTLPSTPDIDLTPLPESFNVPSIYNQTFAFIGGGINKRKGSAITYSADVKFGVYGSISGDLTLNGKAQTRFRMLSDTVTIAARAGFTNTNPSYLYHKFISNHFAWSNKLNRVRTTKIGGSLTIPWTRTKINVDFDNVGNYLYFNSDCLPTQYTSELQVFAASLEQNLKFGIWNWNNRITYQTSSNQEVCPLPALAIYSNMFLGFRAFSVLNCQIGVDCDYYTSYNAMNYQPAISVFHVQDPDNAIKVGNFPFMNLYATARLYNVRLYVMWSHFNTLFGKKNYFSLPHYPLNPARFQIGLSVDFPN